MKARLNKSTLAAAAVCAAMCLLPATTCLAEKDALSDLPSYSQAIWRMVVSLLAIIVALLVAAKSLSWWLARRPGRQTGRLIEVVEQQRLEPRKSVYLLRVAGQYLLVGSSEGHLQTLAGGELDQQKIAAALRQAGHEVKVEKMPPERSFAEVLNK